MSLPGRLLAVDGVRIFYHRSGPRSEQPPILLVHGFSVTHWGWRQVVERLRAADQEVIALDLPGHGESDRPPVKSYRYDAEAFSRTVVGFLDALEIPRVRLVGHSMGGAVSLVTAANHPARVDRLVMCDALVYPYTLPPEGKLLAAPIIGPALYRNLQNKLLVKRYFREQVYEDPSIVDEDFIDYLWERLNRPGSNAAMYAALKFCSDPTMVARNVLRVKAPTLVVWGEKDKLFPADAANRLASEIPGARAVIIPDCGHAPPEECPDLFMQAVLPFLATRETPKRVTA